MQIQGRGRGAHQILRLFSCILVHGLKSKTARAATATLWFYLEVRRIKMQTNEAARGINYSKLACFARPANLVTHIPVGFCQQLATALIIFKDTELVPFSQNEEKVFLTVVRPEKLQDGYVPKNGHVNHALRDV